MDNVYAPPGQLGGRPPAQSKEPGCAVRMWALVLAFSALVSGLIGVAGLVNELTGDGFVTHEVVAVVALLLPVPLWFRAARSFWTGGPRAWIWVLAPVALLIPLLVLGALVGVALQ